MPEPYFPPHEDFPDGPRPARPLKAVPGIAPHVEISTKRGPLIRAPENKPLVALVVMLVGLLVFMTVRGVMS